ncbi:helix-turn-helix domain-containing protein [Phormidium sp. LEGE 05292]|uniref:helix-turn-helix domain-containing protein n=1 Tax=[Phormidium] sp. LEGE 05292 TaxID=767427 RepID=UPI001881CA6E|nr:RodZ domain-containing protein [Phormidium sp. LEGE 05292]MBE9228516.1 helix-turn-helix domain-containing protein [Phormidium sp. LEGE 05292]
MKTNKRDDLGSYLEEQRAKKLAEMGEYLRHLREQQALSLDDVASITKVPARMLNAIEEGRLEPLPEPVYTKGFIKRYAEALGLNGSEFASVFPTAQVLTAKRQFWGELPAAQLKPIHLYLLYIVLIILAVTGLSQMVDRSAQQAVLPTAEKPPSTSKKPANSSPDQTKDKVALVSMNDANNSSEPVKVGLNVTSDSWVRVVVDGKKDFEGTLSQGTQRTWTAKQEIVVRAGNAGGVMVAYNNEEAKQLGSPGKIKQVIFKAD